MQKIVLYMMDFLSFFERKKVRQSNITSREEVVERVKSLADHLGFFKSEEFQYGTLESNSERRIEFRESFNEFRNFTRFYNISLETEVGLSSSEIKKIEEVSVLI